MTVLVFGGNGFVGSRVCEQGVNMGLNVVSVSRSGGHNRTVHPFSLPWPSQPNQLLGVGLDPVFMFVKL